MHVADSPEERLGEPGSRWARRPGWVDPLIVWAATFMVCLMGAGRPAWSGDEAATVVILRRGGDQFWAAVRGDSAIGPYYVLMRPLSLLTMSPWALRLPSVAAMAGAAAVLFVLVRRTAGARLAVGSAVALNLMPAATRYGQDARPYAMAVLGVTLVVWCWWRWMESEGAWWGIALGASLVFTGLMHAYGLLICLPLLILAGLRPPHSRRRAVARTVSAIVVAVFALSPFLVGLVGTGAGQPNPSTLTVRHMAEEWARLPMGILKVQWAPLAAGAILLLGCAGVVALGLRRCRCDPGFALLPILWLATPPMVLVALQLLTTAPGLVARYWVICLPALAIGVSATLTCARGGPWLPILGFSVLVLLVAPAQWALRGSDGHVGQRWVALDDVLAEPALTEVPLLIRGFSQRGLSANAPGLTWDRTPLNGDPGPGGRISPIPYGQGTVQYRDLVDTEDMVLIYQQRPDAGSTTPDAEDFTQTEDVRSTFSEAVVLCQWFGDAVGLFAKPGTNSDTIRRDELAAVLEGGDPSRIECHPGL